MIELLVVVAIIGMLVSVIMVSFDNSRRRSRDARRLSDMNQIKSGLDLYFLHGAGYPPTSSWVAGSLLVCNGVQMLRIPQDILSGFSYIYVEGGTTSPSPCGGNAHSNYYVQFATEGETHLGPPGTYYMHPGGISSTAPF